MKTEKFCQSCAMPLNQNGIDNRGTESDGSKSHEYCNLCYLNGKFNNPNATYEGTLSLGIQGIKNSNENKFKKWILIKSYPMMLKQCKRWNNK